MKDKAIEDAMNALEKIILDVYDQGYNEGYTDGYNNGYDDGMNYDKRYESGLNDAWECARKMETMLFNDPQFEECFGKGASYHTVMRNLTPSEAIAKLKEYEEKQKRTCDTCQYGGHTLSNIRHCVYCDGSYYWTPKQAEQRCKSKMTLDEAIKHCEEVADRKCDECGAEHRQLAEWLKELKQLREQTTWIPVTERLPKTADVYRVTRYYLNNVMNPNYIVDACFFDGSNTWYNDNRINHERNYADNIIAWQENPEPYKTESEE